MQTENIYDSLMQIFGKIPDNINILEDQIDIDVQMSYFDISQKYKTNKPEVEEINRIKAELFDTDIEDTEKKEFLVKLANIDDVEAYRTIEKYNKDVNEDMREWTSLALQESRMTLESFLLNEDQIIISTGLGGKDNKLRYCLAFSSNNAEDFTELQERLFTKELEFSFRKNAGKIENIEFHTRYCLLTSLLPINVSINNIISNTIEECNQIGNFIEKRFIVTNVKILSIDDIFDYWEK